MSYLGRAPTGSILTGADIADGSISTAKIADTAISTAKIADDAVTFAKYVEAPSFRNLIINGDMSIAQRSTSATSISSSGYHALDRFRFGFTDTDQLVATISQDTDVPSGQGFSKSMKFLVTTVESALDANDALQIQYRIEGQNLQQLKYGTSSAESLTLSFWVKSSVTGTYALTFKNSDDGGTKLNVNTYSISSANTWEKKTITISGDTATNIDNTNGNKLEVLWGLTAGSNYKGTSSSGWTSYSASKLFNGQTADIATTSSANFYLTGVQLEVGTSASDFEFLPFDVNLQRCERYYQILAGMTGQHNGTQSHLGISFRTQMRAQGTLSCPSNSIGFTDGYASQYNTTSANPAWTSSYFNYGGRVLISGLPNLSGDPRRGTMIHNSGSGLIVDSEL